MKKLALALVVVAAVFTASCGGNPETIRKSWHESFISSCSKDGDEAKVAMCTCMADHAIKELTPDQLLDLSGSIKYIQEKAAPACAAELGQEPEQR